MVSAYAALVGEELRNVEVLPIARGTDAEGVAVIERVRFAGLQPLVALLRFLRGELVDVADALIQVRGALADAADEFDLAGSRLLGPLGSNRLGALLEVVALLGQVVDRGVGQILLELNLLLRIQRRGCFRLRGICLRNLGLRRV